MLVTLSKKSGNVKTGPIPVSMTEAKSCPNSCPFKTKGCYGKYNHLKGHWDKVVDRGSEWKEFCDKIATLPKGQVWRHNQVGDLPGINNKINAGQLRALVKANKGKRGFTYSHKNVLTNKANRAAVRHANKNGFTVNLSANSLAHADKLSALKVGPVCVVLPTDALTGKRYVTPKGRKVVLCPAQVRDDITCATCQLCAKVDRKTLIGFAAHGTAKKSVSETVKE